MKHPDTDEAIFEEILHFAAKAGLVPIRIEKEQPGYLINTMLVPWLFASLLLVVNGVSSYQDVDRTWILCNNGSTPGPMGVFDMVGFEVARNIARLLAAAEPDNPLYQKPIDYLEENFINRGYTGALSGRGFYSYPDRVYLEPGFLSPAHS